MNTPRHFGTDQKASTRKRYLVARVPISDLCDEYDIKPNRIYAWQKIPVRPYRDGLFQEAGGRAAGKLSAQEKIARLEVKLRQNNEVIAELMEENIRSKKAHGER